MKYRADSYISCDKPWGQSRGLSQSWLNHFCDQWQWPSINMTWTRLSLSMRQTMCIEGHGYKVQGYSVSRLLLLRSWTCGFHQFKKCFTKSLSNALHYWNCSCQVLRDWFDFCLCTHQVNFFLQIIHILIPFTLLAFLLLAIWGCRQFVLLFASLDWRKWDKMSLWIRLSTCGNTAL